MDNKKLVPMLLCALLSVLVVTTCGCTTTQNTKSTKLTVFAAASLTDAFNQAAQAFEVNNSGVNVAVNYAGSQILATQLQQGAPADVFASADLAHMNSVQDAGLMNNSSVVIFAENKLAIIVLTLRGRKHHEPQLPRKVRSKTRYREQFYPLWDVHDANARKSV